MSVGKYVRRFLGMTALTTVVLGSSVWAEEEMPEGFRIVTVDSFAGEEHDIIGGGISERGTKAKEVGEEIAEAVDGAQVTSLEDEEVSRAALETLPSCDVLIWHGHGNYLDMTGAFLSLGERKEEQLGDLSYLYQWTAKGIIDGTVGNVNYWAVNAKFFQNKASDGWEIRNGMVYLAACHSAHEPDLVNAFLGAGAKVVFANVGENDIGSIYDQWMLKEVCDYMSGNGILDDNSTDEGIYYTAREALAKAQEWVRAAFSYAFNQEWQGGSFTPMREDENHQIIVEQNPQIRAALFGDGDYTLVSGIKGRIAAGGTNANPEAVTLKLSNGKEPDVWVSTMEPFYFNKLTPGEDYTLEVYYNDRLLQSIGNIHIDEHRFTDLGTITISPLQVVVTLESGNDKSLANSFLNVYGADGTSYDVRSLGSDIYLVNLLPDLYQFQAGADGCDTVTQTEDIDLKHEDLVITLGSPDWQQAYAEILRSNLAQMSQYSMVPKFALAYVDNDEIPELITAMSNIHIAGCQVYTMYEGQAVELGEFGDFGTVAFAPHTGILCPDYFINGGYEGTKYFEIENGESVYRNQFFKYVTDEIYYVGATEEPFNSYNQVSKEAYDYQKSQWSGVDAAAVSVGYDNGLVEVNESSMNVLLSDGYSSLVVG